MKFDRAWKLFLGVKLSTKHLWQHLINPNISQEQIVVSEELSFVFEFPEISFESIEADDLGDTRNVQILNLLSEGALRILNDNTNSSVVFLRVERICDTNLNRSHGHLFRNLSHSEVDAQSGILFSQK